MAESFTITLDTAQALAKIQELEAELERYRAKVAAAGNLPLSAADPNRPGTAYSTIFSESKGAAAEAQTELQRYQRTLGEVIQTGKVTSGQIPVLASTGIDDATVKLRAYNELTKEQLSSARELGATVNIARAQGATPAMMTTGQIPPGVQRVSIDAQPDPTRIDTSATSLKQLKREVLDAKNAIDGSVASYERYLNAQEALASNTARFNEGLRQLKATQTQQTQPTAAPVKTFEQEKAEAAARDLERAQAKAAQSGTAAVPTAYASGLREVSKEAEAAATSTANLSANADVFGTLIKQNGGDVRAAALDMQALGRSEQEIASAAQELGVAYETPAKNLGQLRRELNDAKNAYTGSEETTKNLANASKAYDDALRGANETMGKNKSLTDQLGATFERQVMRIAIGIAVWTTLRHVQQEIQQTIKAMEDYSIEVARFAAITDQSIGQAINSYRALREEAVRGGFTPEQAAPGIIEAARFQKSPAAQQELFGAATRLAEVMGLKDATQATNALGEAELATGQSATEMADLIFSAYKRVGGNATEFMNIIPSINSLADEMGIKFERALAIVTSGAAASGQTMGTVYQAANRFSEIIGGLDGDKLLTFVNGFRELGVNVQKSNGDLMNTGDIFAAIGERWNQLSSEQQSRVISLLGGERVKGTARNAGMGIMQSFADGMTDSLGDVKGAVDKAASIIDQSFGQMVKQLDARIQEMRAEGDVAGATFADIGKSASVFLGSLFGGAEGGRAAIQRSTIATSLDTRGGAQTKADFIKSLTGLSPDDARAAIDEYNSLIEHLRQFGHGEARNAAIAEGEKQSIVTELKSTGTLAGDAMHGAFAQAISGIGKSVVDALHKAVPGIFGAAKEAGAGAAQGAAQGAAGNITLPERDPQADFKTLAAKYLSTLQAGTQVGFSSLQSILPTEPLDLRKMSEDEIAQAKQLSLQMSMQELDAIREQALAMGLTKDQADAIVAARKQELETTVALLETQRGMHYETGLEVANIEKATQQIKQQAEERKSNFQFRRLRDVDPAQFGQLNALTQMYDQFLSNIGSPEKQMHINLLMGENNTFKTMNARMTALQLALEDLTKVEKAQLSGTWNLPAGATALVPIASLDLQRWNKSAGGGLSEEAIRALLGATSQSGDQVSESQQLAATRIISALHDTFSRIGIPTVAVDKAKTVTEAVTAARETLRGQDTATVGRFYDEWAKQKMPMVYRFTDPAERSPWYEQYGMRPQDRMHEAARRDTRAAPESITVSALPIKANFNANLMVVLNGSIVARMLIPIMYDAIAKMTASTGTRPKGTTR